MPGRDSTGRTGFQPALAPLLTALVVLLGFLSPAAGQNLAVKGQTVHTMAGRAIGDGVVVITGGKVAAVGAADEVAIPEGYTVLEAAVVTPGLIDARATVGLTGILNIPHDQDQLDRSTAMQPELRALDAYNPQEELVGWVRGFGITTVHTGHAPGELIPGLTGVFKTAGNTADEAVLREPLALACTLSPIAQRSGGSPGTRAKMMAMLRSELLKAREHVRKQDAEDEDKRPRPDLKMDILAAVLRREMPLLVTANRAQDIASVLRLAEEFDLRIILDSGAEAYLLADEIKAAGVPVIVHPMMYRARGDYENMSFLSPAKLRGAGIPIAMQSGYESYVPKSRVVLFEAAIAAANGLSFEEAMAMITIDAARILGIDDRVGSIQVGKDGDLALYDGDPFEYTTHCVGVVIDGWVVHDEPR